MEIVALPRSRWVPDLSGAFAFGAADSWKTARLWHAVGVPEPGGMGWKAAQVWDRVMTASSGRASPASISMALMMPTGTGQAVW